MAMNNATSDAQRFGQIWNLILDILDQINTAIGEHEITQAEFFAYMRAAMTQCSIRTIPSGVDRVYVGTVEKNQAINSAVITVHFCRRYSFGHLPFRNGNRRLFVKCGQRAAL